MKTAENFCAERSPSGRISWIPALLVIFLMVCAWIGDDWGLPGPARSLLYNPNGEAASYLESAGSLMSQDLAVKRQRGSSAILPVEDRASTVARLYRRFALYSHHPDEGRAFIGFANMAPAGWDFNPRTFQYGGLFYYPLGAWYWGLDRLGICRLVSDTSFYLAHPEEMGTLLRWGRIYAALWAVLAIPALWGLGRLLWGERGALALAVLWSLHPAVQDQIHVLKPHLPATVFVVLSLFMAIRYSQAGRVRDLAASSLSAGLASGMSTVVSPAWLIPLVAAFWTPMGWTSRMVRVAASVLALAAVFFLCNPYLLTSLEVWRHEMETHRATTGPFPAPWGVYATFLRDVLPGWYGWVLLAPTAVGLWALRRRPWRLCVILPLVGAALFYLYVNRSRIYERGNLRFVISFLPLVIVLCVEGLREWVRRHRRGGIAAIAACAAALALSSWAILDCCRQDVGEGSTRLAAARWVNAHLAPGDLEVPLGGEPWDLPPFAFMRHLFLPDGTERTTPADHHFVICNHELNGPPPGWRLVRSWEPRFGVLGQIFYPRFMSYAQVPVALYRRESR